MLRLQGPRGHRQTRGTRRARKREEEGASGGQCLTCASSVPEKSCAPPSGPFASLPTTWPCAEPLRTRLPARLQVVKSTGGEPVAQAGRGAAPGWDECRWTPTPPSRSGHGTPPEWEAPPFGAGPATSDRRSPVCCTEKHHESCTLPPAQPPPPGVHES